jgi:hypothetical protein
MIGHGENVHRAVRCSPSCNGQAPLFIRSPNSGYQDQTQQYPRWLPEEKQEQFEEVMDVLRASYPEIRNFDPNAFCNPQLWCETEGGCYQSTVPDVVGLRYHDATGVPMDKVPFSTFELLMWQLVNKREVQDDDKDLRRERVRGAQADYIPMGDEVPAAPCQVKVLRKVRMSPEKALSLAFPLLFPG